MFQKRHYTKMARAVVNIDIDADRETVALFLAGVFGEDNPLFNRTKFLQACGYHE